MDGWESRRKRVAGHEALVKLGIKDVIRGVDLEALKAAALLPPGQGNCDVVLLDTPGLIPAPNGARLRQADPRRSTPSRTVAQRVGWPMQISVR